MLQPEQLGDVQRISKRVSERWALLRGSAVLRGWAAPGGAAEEEGDVAPLLVRLLGDSVDALESAFEIAAYGSDGEVADDDERTAALQQSARKLDALRVDGALLSLVQQHLAPYLTGIPPGVVRATSQQAASTRKPVVTDGKSAAEAGDDVALDGDVTAAHDAAWPTAEAVVIGEPGRLKEMSMVLS